MRLARQFVHFLVAVTVLVAAYLVPSAAEAHAGHHHPAPAVSASASKPPEAGIPVSKATLRVGPATILTAPSLGAPRWAERCDGLCCSTGMACCCAHALVAEAGAALPAPTTVRLARMPELSFRPGIDPEALPKPPRTIA